jgi:hypothetical protein
MNLKLKGTLVILSLMLVSSLLLSMNENTQTPKPVNQITINLIKSNSNKEITTTGVHQTINTVKSKEVQRIELIHPGLNAELPLPELMQQIGFKIETDTTNINFSD